MTDPVQAVSTDDLHAFVDGALDAEARARVEAYLKTSAEDAERVRAYQRQNEALRALGATLDRTPGGAVIHVRRKAVWRVIHALPWAAAVAGLLVLGAAGGWWARGTFSPNRPELYQLAAGAYRLYTVQETRPVEIWANQRDQLQSWLGSVLNAPFVAPELVPQGYTLVGGRLLSNASGPAALLIYQGANNQRIALYVAQSSVWGEGKAVFETVGDLKTFTWKWGPLWYSLAGDLKPDEMKVMARSVNKQQTGTTDLSASEMNVARRR